LIFKVFWLYLFFKKGKKEFFIKSTNNGDIALKIGILFDIHGNIEALNSSLEVLKDTDRILHGGDLIGWGSKPCEVIDAIRERGIEGISGNHEFLVRGVYQEKHPDRNISTSWARKKVSEEHLAFISKLPPFIREEFFYLFHSTPRQYEGKPDASNFPYLKKADDFLPFIKDISKVKPGLILLGHVHVPACYSFCTKSNTIETIKLPSSLDGHQVSYQHSKDNKTIVVGGSLGWPRGEKEVFVLVVDEEDETVTFREVPYNLKAYQRSMNSEKLQYPARLKNIFSEACCIQS